jgi:hypothetical protein
VRRARTDPSDANGEDAHGQADGRRQHGTAEAREGRARRGKKPSAVGATLGASKQRQQAASGMTHQQRLDLRREGKHDVTAANTAQARPRNRDGDTPGRESHPRL